MRLITTVSSGSTVVSGVGLTVMVPLVWPAAITKGELIVA
ncbi:UNVERIFIED_ORG: hypothetical protein ABIB63_001856 [Xanthomonas axonopodis]